MFSDLLFRFRALFRAKLMDAGLDEELRFHLDRQAEKYMQAGLTPEEARRRVRLDFGGASQIKEQCREARGIRTFEALRQDFPAPRRPPKYGWAWQDQPQSNPAPGHLAFLRGPAFSTLLLHCVIRRSIH